MKWSPHLNPRETSLSTKMRTIQSFAAVGIREHPTGLSREPEDLVELSVGQEPCVARNASAMELELQPAVELEPERPLSRFTHWIPPPEGVSGG